MIEGVIHYQIEDSEGSVPIQFPSLEELSMVDVLIAILEDIQGSEVSQT